MRLPDMATPCAQQLPSGRCCAHLFQTRQPDESNAPGLRPGRYGPGNEGQWLGPATGPALLRERGNGSNAGTRAQ